MNKRTEQAVLCGCVADLVVGVDDRVGGHALGGAGLGPGVDGVLVSGEDGEPAVMGMPGQ